MAICLFVCFSAKTAANLPASPSEPTAPLGGVYLFGVSQSLKDSLVFISDIHEVAGAMLDKQNFLQHHEGYTQQFHHFIESSQQRPNQTTAVFYAKDFNSLNKKLAKIIKRLDGQKVGAMRQKIQIVSKDQFVFKPVQ